MLFLPLEFIAPGFHDGTNFCHKAVKSSGASFDMNPIDLLKRIKFDLYFYSGADNVVRNFVYQLHIPLIFRGQPGVCERQN